jgi:hypothetical protein
VSLVAAYPEQVSGNPFWTSVGQSQTAEKLANRASTISAGRFITGTYLVHGQPTYNRLSELQNEFAADKWGGEGQVALSVASLKDAEEFLGVLPMKFGSPDLNIEPSGYVTFEWYFGPFRSMIVAFRGGGSLGYSVLFGRNRTAFGNEQFYYGQIPLALFRHLFEVAA